MLEREMPEGAVNHFTAPFYEKIRRGQDLQYEPGIICFSVFTLYVLLIDFVHKCIDGQCPSL